MAEELIISSADILKEIEKLLKFPRPHVCKHYVCCNLLGLLKKSGYVPPPGLVMAVVDADDEEAFRIIKDENDKSK
jgi:hypothetical protein